MPDTIRAEKLFEEGMTALRAGDSVTAREKLSQVVAEDQLHEQAWLWLSTVVETQDEKRVCLQNVLTINPDHALARERLQALDASPHDPPQEVDEPLRYAVGSPPAELAANYDPADESWRAVILDIGDAKSVSLELDEPRHKPTRADLVWTWIAAVLFRRSSDYVTELTTADVGHIGLNMIAIAALRILAVIIFSVMLLVSNRGGYQQAIEPVAAYLEEVGQMDTSFFIPAPFRAAVASANAVWGIFSARPFDRLFNRIGALGQQFRDLALRVQQLLLLLWLVYALAISIFTAVEQFYRVTIIHQLTAWLMRGKGDILQTAHALTTGLTAAMWVFLALAFIMPLVPLRVAVYMLVAWGAYRLLLQANTLDTVHEISVFAAIADLLLGGFIIFVTISLVISFAL